MRAVAKQVVRMRHCIVPAILLSGLVGCSAGQAPWSVNCENQAAAKNDPGFYTECMRHE
jgi:hypothetical protein